MTSTRHEGILHYSFSTLHYIYRQLFLLLKNQTKQNMKNQTSLPLAARQLFQFIFLSILLVSLSSCAAMMLGGIGEMGGSGGSDPSEFDFEYEETSFSFTILQMNDVYEIASLEKGKVGGMARVATLRNELYYESDDVLTVLAGDFLSPSLIGTMKYEGERIKGRQMVEVMNEMGVNVVAFGNHEFDLKEEELQARLDESYFNWIGTNVLHKKGEHLEPFYKESYGYKYHIPETYIWEVSDYMSGTSIKVGFYSACINSNEKGWVHYEDPFQEATKAYLELAAECDVIIGLTHLDLAQDMKLATILPNTPLIMGGHEHENSRDTVGNVVITKADANAKSVYVHRFTYDKSIDYLTFTSELVPITDEIEDDQYVAEIVEKWAQIQHDNIAEIIENPDEIIYRAKEPLDGREKSVRTMQTNLGGLIAGGMAAAAKKPADCAFFNGGSIRLDDQLTGNLTAVDLFRALPFGGSVYEIDIKGSWLKKALDTGWAGAGSGSYLQWHNISYDESSKTWKIAGKKLNESKVYHVVVNDYLAEGRSSRLDFLNPDNYVKVEKPNPEDKSDLRSDMRRAVIAHMKEMNQ